MKNITEWIFQVKDNPEEISKKLKSSFGGVDRFVLSMNSDQFKIRKRLSLPFEINTQNNIIVNGRILKTDSESRTDVKISFSHHPLSRLLIYGHLILGLGLLAGIFLKVSNNPYVFMVAGVLLAIGILLGIHLRKDFKKNVQEYKKLISDILEPQNLT